MEQVALLGHEADGGGQRAPGGPAARRCPSMLDRPAGDVVQPRDQVADRGLARSAGPDQCQQLARVGLEADTGQGVLAGARIVEVHVPGDHVRPGELARHFLVHLRSSAPDPSFAAKLIGVRGAGAQVGKSRFLTPIEPGDAGQAGGSPATTGAWWRTAVTMTIALTTSAVPQVPGPGGVHHRSLLSRRA